MTVARRAPDGAPNVLIVLFDDLGFAQLGCYGSDVDTPNIDRLAGAGLRYNRFHVTALCSASRAALLTGRNHHAVNVATVTDFPLAHRGYTCHRPDDAGTLAQVMVDAGYSAYAIGKWHLTPRGQRSRSGPFTSWPLGWGFERYYGFLNGDCNHWQPQLVCDNHFVDVGDGMSPGYHLTEDLAEQTIQMLVDQHQATPDKPFLAYFSLGAMHAPHHVHRDWVEPYSGRFDDGWEAARERAFVRQRASGLIPPGAALSERPSWVPRWSDLDDDDRRLYARMQETYAGFLTHTDAQIGRIVDHLASTGQLDNTIVLVMSDNGASAEGGVQGTANEMRFTRRLPESTSQNLAHLDDWGGHRAYSHYAWGWAWAGNTPFRLWKRYAWLGGTRSPLIVHWPAGIAESESGSTRDQICHIVDVMPTVLDAAGIEQPDRVGGVQQADLHGASLLQSFRDSDSPSPRSTQYFEMLGSRSIIHGEWKATTDHVSRGVADEEALLEGSREFDQDHWALFDLGSDFAECHDVADAHPAVLADLRDRWQLEAERNHVLPLQDSIRLEDSPALPLAYPVTSPRTYTPAASPTIDDAIPKLGFGGTISAAITIPGGDAARGVICALGDWHGGFAIYCIDGAPAAVLNNGGDPMVVRSPAALEPGDHEVTLRLELTGEGSRVHLGVDGIEVDTATSPHGLPATFQHGGAALRIGFDSGFPVCDDYSVPSPFTGSVDHVTIDATGGPLGRADVEAAVAAD